MSEGIVTGSPGQIAYRDGEDRPLSLDTAGRLRVAVEQADGSSSAVANVAADRSGTVTTGGASQAVAPANIARRGFWIANTSPTDLYLCESGAAMAGGSSVRLPPGEAFAFNYTLGYVPKGVISLYGLTTGQTFVAREW